MILMSVSKLLCYCYYRAKLLCFLGSQTSERDRDEVTFFYVGDLFCIHLGTKYANFQEKIVSEISGKKFRTLKWIFINYPKFELFPRNLRKIFFLKIGILNLKVYTKNVPNIEVWNFILAPLRTLPFK